MSLEPVLPWQPPTAHLPAPLVAVDLAAFDANADALVRRAGGLPVRVASKSVRCRPLLERALARPGFRGVMAYAAAEAVWLVRGGVDDVFVAYPSVDREAVAEVAGDDRLRAQVTLTIDSVEHVDLLASWLGRSSGVRVAIDVDASLRLGGVHLGVRRSPVRTPEDAHALAQAAVRAGLAVVGVLFYDAQVAGLPDSGPHIRLLKRRSMGDLARRRGPVVEAVRSVADVQFVNAGGTGSLHLYGAEAVSGRAGDGVVTELAAGSGLYGSGLFDGYDDFTPRPAMAYAVPVVRRPAPGIVTAFSGGYVASGEPGWSRVPRVVTRGLGLLRTEAAGEVQTPLRGMAADRLALGDRVWLRGAKAGELLERFDQVHLVREGELVATVPSYRGEGRNFG